jgi:hypothetical protein
MPGMAIPKAWRPYRPESMAGCFMTGCVRSSSVPPCDRCREGQPTDGRRSLTSPLRWSGGSVRRLRCVMHLNGLKGPDASSVRATFLIAYLCKGYGARRGMVETAAHLSEHIFPRIRSGSWCCRCRSGCALPTERPTVQTMALHLFLSAVEQSIPRCSPGRLSRNRRRDSDPGAQPSAERSRQPRSPGRCA